MSPRNRVEADRRAFAGTSEALRALALILVPALIAIGVYIVVHGQLTPGSRFQGGLILAAAPLAVLVAGRYMRMRIVAPHTLVELGDAHRGHRLRADRTRRPGVRRRLLQELLALPYTRTSAVAGQIDLASTAVGLEVSEEGRSSSPGASFSTKPSSSRTSREIVSFLPFAIAAWLFLIGLYGIVFDRDLIRMILSLTVVPSATYLVLLGVGYRNGAQTPKFSPTSRQVSETVDPVVQVLVFDRHRDRGHDHWPSARPRGAGPRAVRQPGSGKATGVARLGRGGFAALPVAVPMIAAAALVAGRHWSPRWVNNLGATGIAASVVGLCAILLVHATHSPIAYWMGGWRPVARSRSGSRSRSIRSARDWPRSPPCW